MTETCPICFDDLKKVKRIVLTLPCGHKYCKKCLATYARTAIQDVLTVKCPDPKCEATLDLNGLIGKKWIAEAKKEVKHNACPVTQCRGVIKEGQCDKCGVKICDSCGEIAHVGKECQPDIRASHQRLQQESRECPKCHVSIYKDGGCNHVKCSRCKTHFDWATLKPCKHGAVTPTTWNDQQINHPHYDTDFLRTLGYRVGLPLEEQDQPPILGEPPEEMPYRITEGEEPEMTECLLCQRLCLLPNGLCCSCNEEPRANHCDLCRA